jgi:hypothetical protein
LTASWFDGKLVDMKTTIDLPDQLLIEVKVLAARKRRRLKDLMAELVRAGLQQEGMQSESLDDEGRRTAAARWWESWSRLSEVSRATVTGGPSAREILVADRDRLEEGSSTC